MRSLPPLLFPWIFCLLGGSTSSPPPPSPLQAGLSPPPPPPPPALLHYDDGHLRWRGYHRHRQHLGGDGRRQQEALLPYRYGGGHVQIHPHFLQGDPNDHRYEQESPWGAGDYEEEEQEEEEEDESLGLLPDLTVGVKSVSDALATVMRLIQVFPSLEEGERGRGSKDEENKSFSVPWKTLDKLDRRQCRPSDRLPFPCDRESVQNYYRPPTIEELTPGDIRVVGAMGDFMVAGTGALAEELSESGTDFRGTSFVTGGDGSWRDNLSVANLLRQFNPGVVGASRGSGKSSSSRAGLNVAEKSSTSRDLVGQAKTLVRKINALRSVDSVRDWKLLFVSPGHNDLCRHSCQSAANASSAMPDSNDANATVVTAEEFSLHLTEALDLLSRELPNSLVVVLPPADPAFVTSAFHRPLACRIASGVFCPCAERDREATREGAVRFREEAEELVNSGRYDTYSDFAVVLSPALSELSLPASLASSPVLKALGARWPDLSYLAPNCLYPSQKLHALVAKSVWNGLFQEEAVREGFDPQSRLVCPSAANPYFVTRKLPERVASRTGERTLSRRARNAGYKTKTKESETCGLI